MSPAVSSQDGGLVHTVVHSFTMGDVDDPYIYAAGPLYEFQQTELGKYCHEKTLKELYYTISPDMNTFGFRVNVFSVFNEQDYVFYKLKYK